MKQCILLNGSTVVIDNSEHLEWESSIEDAHSAVREQLDSVTPTTGERVVDEGILGIEDHLRSVETADLLELSTVVSYPGEESELPETVAIVETFEQVVSTVASWRANNPPAPTVEA